MTGDFLNRQTGLSQSNDFAAVEDALGATDGVPGFCAVLPRGFHPGADPFSDQLALELRDGRQDVSEQATGRVGGVRVESLRHADEPNAERSQFLDLRDAMNE